MRVVVLCFLNLLIVIGSDGWSDNRVRKFPKNFLFGAATSAYQVEGSWIEDGKGESIWDRFVHERPELIADGRNGDEASDSYRYWQRDIQMLRELGVDFYRFSISWPRVLPTGLVSNQINEAGFKYYDDLIDELLKYSIQPMVTLYHFDLPQELQDLGGWTNPLSVTWFEDYARVIFKRYAAKVKFWITMNQPNTICMDGYGSGIMAPGLNNKDGSAYECVKNVLLAHAKAYRLYEKEFEKEHQGNVGIGIAVNWFDPLSNTTENVEATERARAFEFGIYLNPIWGKEGDFPAVVKSIVDKKSKEQGFETSRLPTLTAKEIKLLKGSADFLGMNHYTTFLVQPGKTKYDSPSVDDDRNTEYTQGSEWKPAKSPWLKSAPYGLYKACIHLNLNYDYLPIIITEHGWSSDTGLRDQSRVDNMRAYLGALLLAMEDGTQVKGYTVWSLMDNVEWTAGTSERFGLYEVDFESESKKRTARLSALVYKHIIEAREVEDNWAPSSLKIEITKNEKKNNYNLAIAACHGSVVRQDRKFPDDFLFGTATAAYQIEGGWDADGKGENIWDYLVHTNPTAIKGESNGDVAADSYNNYKRDVEMMRELGLDAYRFSMSWSRILPTGMANEVNPAGIEFYNNYINEMLKYNIEPLVTLYHWDLPQKLQELGGFANPLFSGWFEDYARVVYENFGDRVKKFITFNEPREICFEGYGADTKAPILNSTAMGTYLCAKHLVVAHAKAYHLYDKEFRPTQQGQCGITISVNWFEPATDTPEDEVAAELRRQGEWGIYAHPIFSSEGGFPKELSEKIAENSAKQGYSRSRLPEFTEEEKAFVSGAFDFFGVNHYSSSLVSATERKPQYPVPSLLDDMDNASYPDDDWVKSASAWLVLAPNSIYKALSHLRTLYNDPIFYITENGWSTYDGRDLIDDDRITYYRASMESMLNCLDDGIKLKGYMAWSLMDNFEWNQGYNERFGLYEVDFSDPSRTRTPKKSAFVYKHIIKNRYVDYEYEPDSMTMTIDEGH